MSKIPDRPPIHCQKSPPPLRGAGHGSRLTFDHSRIIILPLLRQRLAERLALGHWPASALVEAFGIEPAEATLLVVRMGSYPGAFEVDGVPDGSWGTWAIEVKTGPFGVLEMRGLLEFAKRFPKYQPLLLCDAERLPAAERLGVTTISWERFLLSGPPGASPENKETP